MAQFLDLPGGEPYLLRGSSVSNKPLSSTSLLACIKAGANIQNVDITAKLMVVPVQKCGYKIKWSVIIRKCLPMYICLELEICLIHLEESSYNKCKNDAILKQRMKAICIVKPLVLSLFSAPNCHILVTYQSSWTTNQKGKSPWEQHTNISWLPCNADCGFTKKSANNIVSKYSSTGFCLRGTGFFQIFHFICFDVSLQLLK